MIDTNLIEKALSLTWKKIYDVSETIAYTDDVEFSIEKFYSYLLSPSFIEKYKIYCKYKWNSQAVMAFWRAIYEHQKWNPESLLSLLEKI